ncbi:MAG TPA: HlyD family efflux transporter periplasmic adaptor subunit [Streptosporangiaceae bacterium]
MKFRFKALAKLREPDELDTPAILTSPRGWVTLGCLAAVTVAAVAWAVLGRLPQSVSASGVITRPYGVAAVQSLYPGLVSGVRASIGSQVREGQEIAVVRDARGASHPVLSLFGGQVVSVEVAAGQVIEAGATVATIERAGPAAGQPVALLLLSPGQAAGVRPGASVQLAVAAAPPTAFGLLRGRIRSIGQFPLTGPEVAALFGGLASARTVAAGTGKLLVTVRLRPDGRTVSGYSWTTVSGPPYPLPPLTPATGSIDLGELAPVTLVFGR